MKYCLAGFLVLTSLMGLSQTYPSTFVKISRLAGGLSAPIDNGAAFGIEHAAIGDLDNDGVIDLAVGATNQGGSLVGAVFILFMNTNGTVNHYTQINNTEPAVEQDSFGSSICGLGDLDGDGVEDIGVGAGYDSDGGFQAGAFWIIFLNSNGTVKARQKISTLQGNFTAPLVTRNVFGTGCATVGDLDHDGVVDIAVGARIPGSVYILFLNTNGTVKSYSQITNGSGGLAIDIDGLFGYGLASLGDVNGDGIPDIAVGGHRSDVTREDSGVVFVIFLTSTGTVKGFKQIADGRGNFTDPTASLLGVGIAGIGDYDQDGVRDMVVGGVDEFTNSGAIWYMMLRADGSVKSSYKISRSARNSDLALDDGDFFGGSISFLGDLNSDGIPDISVGAFLDDDGGSDSGALWLSLCTTAVAAQAGPDTNICSIQIASLNATLPPGATGTWTFASGAGNFSDIHNPASKVGSLSLGSNKLVWTIKSGCAVARDTVLIQVDAVVKPNAGADQVFCKESPSVAINLNGNAPKNGTGKWLVLKGTGIVTSPNSQATAVTNADVGTNLFGWEFPASPYCPVQRDTVSVSLLRPLTAHIAMPDTTFACNPILTITADAPSVGTGAWSISEGDAVISDKGSTPTTITLSDKNKPVTIRWQVSAAGCTNANDQRIIVPFEIGLDLPNVITPNGDGKNDQWKIANIGRANNALRIYNRWGNLVYSISNYNNDWSGGGLDAGVYYYFIKSDQCDTEIKGTLSILR